MDDRISHSVEQGSESWLQLREGFYNASEAPIVCGLSKYKKRDAFLLEKLTGAKEETDDFKQKLFAAGHLAEALARPIAEVEAGCSLDPVVFTRGKLLASLDGYNESASIVFEHKLLNKTNSEIEEIQDLPDQYWPQVEHQMIVSGAKRCLFVVSDGSGREGKYFFIWYESKRARRNQVIAAWMQFEKDLENADVDLLRKKQIIESNDEKLLELSDRILAAELILDNQKARVDELKAEFKKLVGDQATRAGSITISYRDTPKTDYSGMFKHYGIKKADWTTNVPTLTLRVNKK